MEARHGVYVLTNSETKGIVKVGMTTRHVNDRIPELHQTGTIGRYSCVGFIRTDGNPETLERKLHHALRKSHVNNEYFRVSPETVLQVAVGLMSPEDTVVISPIDIAEAQRKAKVQHELEVARKRAEIKRKEEERLRAERKRLDEQAQRERKAREEREAYERAYGNTVAKRVVSHTTETVVDTVGGALRGAACVAPVCIGVLIAVQFAGPAQPIAAFLIPAAIGFAGSIIATVKLMY